MIKENLTQIHGYWCPGFLLHQDINNHGTEYAVYINVFHEEVFQLPAPSPCLEIIENHIGHKGLTHCDHMMPYAMHQASWSTLVWWYLVISSRPCHYLNQCKPTDNWKLRSKIQWNSNQNTCTKILFQENSFKNVVCNIVAILFGLLLCQRLGGPRAHLTQVCTALCPMASFTKELHPWLAKRPLKTNGRLANCGLTSLIKGATGGLWGSTHPGVNQPALSKHLNF